jgi:hypothetical protein
VFDAMLLRVVFIVAALYSAIDEPTNLFTYLWGSCLNATLDPPTIEVAELFVQ